ncbi:alpha/beta hydrolase family protein [Flavobacterium chuncheonense]|uniref:Alpha/beta hydrolase family protein n=1 Tax=Flavobacterium chuncheonense TaxID=2026653 RepID=A0ABW5YJV0_9FLAO
MKKLKLLITFSLLFLSTIAISQNISGLKYFNKVEIKTKKDTIQFLHSTFNESPKPTIIFLQGSLPNPVILKEKDYLWVNFPFDYSKFIKDVNLVIINRKGASLICEFNEYEFVQKEPSLDYLKNDNLYYRVFQTEEVIKYLKKQNWVDKKNIFLVGHSEGYRVTAKVAEKNTLIKKIACLSADPINRISENIIRLQIDNTSLHNDSIRVSKIYKELKDYKNLQNFNKQDYDMNNFISYNENQPIESFKKIKKPILICYGTDDVRAYNNNLLPLLLNKNNLELKIYPDLNHNFLKKEFDKEGNPIGESFHWDNVFKDVVDWLVND